MKKFVAILLIGIFSAFTLTAATDWYTRKFPTQLIKANGRPVNTATALKGKMVAVYFSASWCGPCMGEVPYLVADYAKYHELGFEIFGVSLDSNKEAWINAIKTKELVWKNVSTVQGWAEPAAADYAVSAIPANFLVDSEGTIVATDLRGEALGQKLEELLK